MRVGTISAKILVVDDNETNIEIITHILLSAGYEIAVAYDGEYALELLEALDFDLILLDILLPGISGLEAAKQILNHNQKKDTPIIFLSALNETSDIVRGLNAGAVDYISKPFQEEEVLARIRNQLRIRDLEKEKNRLIQAINNDLDLAKANQQNLVSYHFPPSPAYQIYSSYTPMDKIGGDLITYDLLVNGDLDILFGDVTGHGIAAAMVSLMAIITFKTMNKSFMSPSECMTWIHNTLGPMISSHFISGVYLRYNPENKLISYSMAGHHPIFLIRRDQILKLGTKGFCLMMFPQLQIENEEMILESGDKLFLFSDGMFEVPNKEDHYMGESAFEGIVKKYLELGGESFLKNVQSEVLEYANGMIADDMTMLLLEIN
ncbi:response regulator [Leptospira ryugenii]|uniref:Response regulator n=2 Tax=Leptospira ryugenii TaxID=1917863 RepID=A0A2P2E579_9LEPT|nr:response regulator [Leptospira ryugenii]